MGGSRPQPTGLEHLKNTTQSSCSSEGYCWLRLNSTGQRCHVLLPVPVGFWVQWCHVLLPVPVGFGVPATEPGSSLRPRRDRRSANGNARVCFNTRVPLRSSLASKTIRSAYSLSLRERERESAVVAPPSPTHLYL